MVWNILLEAYTRRGELDKLHAIASTIEGVHRRQLRYFDKIWKALIEGGEIKMSRKVVIEKVCSLCGSTFKCSFDENDEMGRAFAESWEICPKCWRGESEFWKEVEGGDKNEIEKGAERRNEAEDC